MFRGAATFSKQFCSAFSTRLENKDEMEACIAVEKEIDKILCKFASIRENGSKNIEETIEFLSSIKPELEQGTYYFSIFLLQITFEILYIILSLFVLNFTLVE